MEQPHDPVVDAALVVLWLDDVVRGLPPVVVHRHLRVLPKHWGIKKSATVLTRLARLCLLRSVVQRDLFQVLLRIGQISVWRETMLERPLILGLLA